MGSMPLNILVVDRTIPARDISSGSLRLFEVIRLLRLGGAQVTVAVTYPTELSRSAAALNRLGVDTILAAPRDLRSIATQRRVDLVWLSFYDTAETYLPAVRAVFPMIPVVIDTVDVHSLRECRQASVLQDPALHAKAQETRAREERIYRLADALVARQS
jgi:hypothetical protein